MLSDPDLRFGSFRVFPRTDGLWIVYDERRPVGARTVMIFKKLEQATRAAKHWAYQGH